MGKVVGSSASRSRALEPWGDGEPAEPQVGPHLSALQAAAVALARLRSVKRIAEAAEAAAEGGLGAEVLVIAILDEDSRELRALHVRVGRAEARRRLRSIPLGGSSRIAQVARSGRPVFLPPAPRPGRERDGERVIALPSAGESVAMLPLPSTAGPLGVIVFGRSRDHGFSAADVAFLSVLAGLSALAIERARLTGHDSIGPRDAVHAAGARQRVGRLQIDLEQMQIEVDGRLANLTPMEMRLLMFLAEEPGRAQTRGEILRHLWRTEHVGGERACDAHIWNLRRKIERDPARPEILVTRRGVGYALEVG